MRKIAINVLGTFLLASLVSAISLAQEKPSKPGPLTGTWACVSHGGPQGDSNFTLEIQQEGEKISGSIDSPQGGMEFSSGTFKEDTLEIRLETPDGDYVITGKLKDGQLTGSITLDGKPAGTWEAKKAPPSTK